VETRWLGSHLFDRGNLDEAGSAPLSSAMTAEPDPTEIVRSL